MPEIYRQTIRWTDGTVTTLLRGQVKREAEKRRVAPETVAANWEWLRDEAEACFMAPDVYRALILEKGGDDPLFGQS